MSFKKLELQSGIRRVRASGGPTVEDLESARAKTLNRAISRHTLSDGDACSVEEVYEANTITFAELAALSDWLDMKERLRMADQRRREREDRMAEEWEATHALPRG